MKRGNGTFQGSLSFATRVASAVFVSLLFLTSDLLAQTRENIKFYHGRKIRSGEFIIKLKNPADRRVRISLRATQQFMDNAHSRHRMRLKKSFSGLNLHHMEVDPTTASASKDTDQLLDEMKTTNPEIEYIEPNYIVEKLSVGEATASTESAGTLAYNLSQVLTLIGTSYGVTSVPIQAQNSWTLLTASQPTATVAVVDTGVDLNHPSLSYSIWTNTGEIPGNGVDDDRNGFIDDVHGWNFVGRNNNPQDDNGHGTHVAGIAVGVGNNIFQTQTSTTTVQIMPLKFLDANGTGAISDAISAIYYASNNGARVINNSWGGGAYSTAVVEAIAYSYTKDILFVAAAGNSARNNDSTPSYPANYSVPNVLAVAASDGSDQLAGFSNFGRISVPLSSPGVGVLSTWPGNAYAYLSGTSMSAPFVSGTAALMRYQTPQMNSYQIRQLVIQGVDSTPGLNSYVASSGRVNVYNSVNLAMTTALNSSQPSFALSISPHDREIASAIANQGSGCGMISKISGDTEILRRVVVSLALMMLPLVLISVLRKQKVPGYRRKYARYAMESKMTFKIGDQELVGAVKTISMGGSEINTEALLKDGSIITMVISSPNGQEKIEVQGHIVWSESQKRYGVAFENLSDSIKAQIGQWQQNLQKI